MLSPDERSRLLRYNVLLSRSSDEPLHAQLTRSLRNLAVRHFEKGERFYTEEELAQKLGLSVGTVRHSLNRLVDEGLLERHRGQGSFVCETAQASGGNLQVTTLVNTFDSFYNGMFLRELSYCCLKRGHTLDVINPGQDERVSRAIDLSTSREKRTGFVFLCLEPAFTCDLVRAMQAVRAPSVSIDSWLTGYPGVQITVDNEAAIEAGLEHLRQLGHRKIALLLTQQPQYESIGERLNAFEAGVAKRGIEGHVVMFSPLPEFQELTQELRFPTQERFNCLVDRDAAQRVLETGATAVMCISDLAACVLMKHLQAMGKRIPEDISVVGFNDEGTGLMVYPELTTIAQPFAAMAETTLDVLQRVDDVTRHFRLEPHLVVRQSTGPCRDQV